jgi:hypothetical protein
MITHAFALAAGIALAVAIRTASRPDPALALPPPASSVSRSKAGPGGEQLLARLAERFPLGGDYRDITPAKDRGAAARAALQAFFAATHDPELLRLAKARYLHWLESDPGEALSFSAWNPHIELNFADVLAKGLDQADTGFLEQLANRKDGLDGLNQMFSGSFLHRLLMDAIAKHLAREESAASLPARLDGFDERNRDWLRSSLIGHWPRERLSELAPLVDWKSGDHFANHYFQRLRPEDQVRWLRDALQSDLTGQPALARSLLAQLEKATAFPLDERLEWMAKLASRPGQEFSSKSLAESDLSEWLARAYHDPAHPLSDWHHRLREGQLTGNEMMLEVEEAFPELAAREPEEFRRRIASSVAWTDPETSLELLRDLSSEQREEVLFKNLCVHPDVLLRLMTAMPPSSASGLQRRLDAWKRSAEYSMETYGDFYPAWVLALTHGSERDMALAGLADHLEIDDPETARFYRSAMTLPADDHPNDR